MGSSEQLLTPPNESELLQCLNLAYMLLKYFLVGPMTSSFSSMMEMLRILGPFVSKEGLLQANKVGSVCHEGLASWWWPRRAWSFWVTLLFFGFSRSSSS